MGFGVDLGTCGRMGKYVNLNNIIGTGESMYIPATESHLHGQSHGGCDPFRQGCTNRPGNAGHPLLVDLGVIPDIAFCRENIHFILVYNSEKQKTMAQYESRERISASLYQRAQSEMCLFKVNSLEGFILKKAYTYAKTYFEKNCDEILGCEGCALS